MTPADLHIFLKKPAPKHIVHQLWKENIIILSHMETKPIKYRVFIYYYTNWLIMLLKPLMIKHDDYNDPHYAYSTDVLLA